MIDISALKNEDFLNPDHELFKLISDPSFSGKEHDELLKALTDISESMDIKSKAIFYNNLKTAYENIPKSIPPYIKSSYDKNGKERYFVNCAELAEYIRENSHYFFVKNDSTSNTIRYWYSDGYYKMVTNEEIKGFIKRYICDFDTSIVRMNDVNEVFNNLMTDLNFKYDEAINSDENIINFKNGLLYLDTMTLKEHSPGVLSTIQIPCDWNNSPTDTTVFNDFMDTFCNKNSELKKFLLQFMGVCLSNIRGYRFKKALFMVGAGNTGKSQLKSLTEMLLGKNNCSGADLNGLEERFGTSNLYNKRLVGNSDMSFMSVRELKMFKQITGGDAISVEFKGKSSFNYVYRGLLWFCMNALPKFGGDKGDWVYDRIIVVNSTNVIPPEKQDKTLLEKMFSEREGIVYLAVTAMKEAIKNGYNFSVPDVCLENGLSYKEENDSVAMFYRQCCTLRPDGKVIDNCTTKKVFEVYKEWCKDNNGGHFESKTAFIARLENITGKSHDELIKRTSDNLYFFFTLTLEAKNDYAKVYGFDNSV